eukprot:2832902-Karenia_brevis.AAC.1
MEKFSTKSSRACFFSSVMSPSVSGNFFGLHSSLSSAKISAVTDGFEKQGLTGVMPPTHHLVQMSKA